MNGKAGQLTGMANLLYDFFPTSMITPYIGAGAGIAFIDSNSSLGSTQFAWQAMVGVRYNVDANTPVRRRRPLCRARRTRA